MKKRTISLLLVILMIATLLPTHVFAAESGKIGDISWKLSGGTLTISGKGAIPDFDIPDFAPWTMLTGIEKIVIKSGVTSIGTNAFLGYLDGEGNIYGPVTATSIEIPSTVKTINYDAFLFTYHLEKFIVSSSSQYFSTDSQGVLYNKDKTALIWVPGALSGTLKIPKTVTDIDPTSLIYGGELIEKISVASGNAKFVSDDQGGLYYKGKEELLLVPTGFEGHFVVPEGVKTIWNSAFIFCYYLERVTIPEGVTEIPESAFYCCYNLKDIWLPASLKTVGANAFGECTWMINATYYGSKSDWAKIDIAEGNEWLTQCDFVYKGCDHEEEMWKLHGATCTEAEQLQCSICEKVLEGEPALGHKETVVAGTPATCLEDGISDGTKCERCGDMITAQTAIPATGHTGEWTITKEATEKEKGTKERTCTTCGEVEAAEYYLYKLGDVNKDDYINALDATQILRFANGKSSVLDNMTEAEQLGIADVNKDGYVNALDATQILRYANGKSSVLN